MLTRVRSCVAICGELHVLTACLRKCKRCSLYADSFAGAHGAAAIVAKVGNVGIHKSALYMQCKQADSGVCETSKLLWSSRR